MDEDWYHHATSNPSFSETSSEIDTDVPCQHIKIEFKKDPSSDHPPQSEPQPKSTDDVVEVSTPIPTVPDPQFASIRKVVKDVLRDVLNEINQEEDAAAAQRRTDQPLLVPALAEVPNSSLIANNQSSIKPNSSPVQQQRSTQTSDFIMDDHDLATSQPRRDDSNRSDLTVSKFQITSEQMQMIPLFRGDINEDGNEWILNANKAFCVWGWEENNTMKCSYIHHCLRDSALDNYEKLDDETKKNWEAFVAHWRAVYPPSASTAAKTATPMAALREFHKLRLDPSRLSEQVHTDDGKTCWEVHVFARNMLIVGASVSCISEVGMGMTGYIMLPSIVKKELPAYNPRTEPTLKQLYEDLTSLDCTRFAGKLQEEKSREKTNRQRFWAGAGLVCLFVLVIAAGTFLYGFMNDSKTFNEPNLVTDHVHKEKPYYGIGLNIVNAVPFWCQS